jgi:hypothetical protein
MPAIGTVPKRNVYGENVYQRNDVPLTRAPIPSPFVRPWLPALAALVLVGASASAQAPDSARAAVVHTLSFGTRVRLDLLHAGMVEGRFTRGTDTILTLVRHDESTSIRLRDIERLWVRGRATGTGALVGAGVGIVAGVVYGLLIGQVACEPVDGGDCTTAEVAALTGLIGGAGGALAGAGIGLAIPVWRLRFP